MPIADILGTWARWSARASEVFVIPECAVGIRAFVWVRHPPTGQHHLDAFKPHAAAPPTPSGGVAVRMLAASGIGQPTPKGVGAPARTELLSLDSRPEQRFRICSIFFGRLGSSEDPQALADRTRLRNIVRISRAGIFAEFS